MDEHELDELFKDGVDFPEDSVPQQQEGVPQRNNAQTTFDPLAGLFNEDPGQNRSTEKSAKRTRAPLKKLDPEVLLEGGGLSRLRHEAPFLEFNNERGYEEANLAKLMDYYRMWAHSLMPRLGFKDFSRQIMKATKHKRIKTVLNEWQKEYRSNMMQGDENGEQGDDNHNNDGEVSSSPSESSSDSESENGEDGFNLFLAGMRTDTANKRAKINNDNDTRHDDDRYLTVADMDGPQREHRLNNNPPIGKPDQEQTQPNDNDHPMDTTNNAPSKMDIDSDVSDDEPLFINKRQSARKIVEDDDQSD